MAIYDVIAGQSAPWLRRNAAAVLAARAKTIALAPVEFAAGGRALLAPGAAAGGVALYFGFPFEPSLAMSAGAGALAVAVAIAARLRGLGPIISFVSLLAAFAGAGFARADLRAGWIAAPVVSDSERARVVTGWVERIDATATGRPRYTLRVTALEGVGVAETPYRVRVVGAGRAARPGQGVAVRAVIRGPPGPAMPGAYNFARSAHFQRLGGVGYAVGAFEAAQEAETPNITRTIVTLRGALAHRLREAGGEAAGPMLAALIVGDRSGVPVETTQALRGAGLGHILAISGLHMALIGGGAFFVLSFGLSSIEPLARRINVRKPAAAGALMVCAIYLIASGGAVSTQRAFVMAAVAFFAILADRRALSLRGVATAAVIVLTLAPESALSPGFQMSFAAATALIAAHQQMRAQFRNRRLPGPVTGWFAAARRYAVGVTMTSLIAGMATAPFAAYHFNRIAVFSLPANMLAMPVFSLAVMPAAAIAGVLAPFGLAEAPAAVAGAGIETVLFVASAAAAMDGALAPAQAGAPLALVLVVTGLLGACALKTGGLRVAAPVWLAAAVIWSAPAPPQMWIGRNGSVVIAMSESETRPGVVGAIARGGTYGAELFRRRIGRGEEARMPPLSQRLACDARGCTGVIGRRLITVARTLDALVEDCARADVVIATVRAPPRLLARCNGASVIEARGGGARLVYIDTNRVRIRETSTSSRPWRRSP